MTTKIEPKKRKMGNNVDFSDDSGIPMDGIEIDSSMAELSNSTNAIDQSIASTTTTTTNAAAAANSTSAPAASTAAYTCNNSNGVSNIAQSSPRLETLVSSGILVAAGDQPTSAAATASLAATSDLQQSNEALASDSPVLSPFEESKCSGGNYSPDFGSGLCDQSCNNPSMEDLSDSQQAALQQQSSADGKDQQQQQQSQQQQTSARNSYALRLVRMMDPSRFSDMAKKSEVRGFGELFDDDDLE